MTEGLWLASGVMCCMGIAGVVAVLLLDTE